MFKMLWLNKKNVFLRRQKKVESYVKDIKEKISSNNNSNIVIFLLKEDKNTTCKIADKLYDSGYNVQIKKYHDIGYEIGIFL